MKRVVQRHVFKNIMTTRLSIFVLSAGAALSVGTGTSRAARIPGEGGLPPYTRNTLPNGAGVYLIPDPEAETLVMRAVIRGGSESDPAGLAGLAALTAELLRDDAASRAGRMRATFESSNNEQSSSVLMRSSGVQQDRALAAFSEVMRRPVFADARFAQIRAASMARAKSVKDNPTAAADLYFRSLLFGPEHPYSSPVDGEELTLSLIDRRGVEAYHKRMYAGRNLIVLAAGNFEPARMLAGIQNTFGSMPAGEPYRWTEDNAPDWPTTPRMLVVDKPGAAQINLVAGQPGVAGNHPDRPALLLMNEWLNSILSGGASATLDQRHLTGSFAIHGSTQAENAGPAINLAIAIFNRVRQKGLSESELAAAKVSLQESAQARAGFQNSSWNLIDELAQAELNTGGAPPERLLDQIDRLTPAQVNAAIRKHIGAGNLSFVLMGDAAKIRKMAGQYAPNIIEVPAGAPGYKVFTQSEEVDPVMRFVRLHSRPQPAFLRTAF